MREAANILLVTLLVGISHDQVANATPVCVRATGLLKEDRWFQFSFFGINGLWLVENFAEGKNDAGFFVEGLFFEGGKYEEFEQKDRRLALT